ncbi:unnamed protein product [Coregonus sp. 'balchen']|nr:unnamed protein product [Coregonus sp. 'balchen']
MRKTVDTDNETKTVDSKETPGSEKKKSYCKLNTVTSERSPGLSTLKKVILLQCTVYISLPVILCLFPWILGHVVCSHWCFGDSSGEPSEVGMTSDAIYLYQWVKTRSRTSEVSKELARERARDLRDITLADLEPSYAVDGVILEAPCISIFQVLRAFFITSCKGTTCLKTLTTRILFLHAEDDNVVPFYMGQKLYQIALQAHRQRDAEDQVDMVSYSESLGYSHNYIYLDPNLPSVVG